MQSPDPALHSAQPELSAFSDNSEATEQLVIFELVVPRAAKVPAPRQPIAQAHLVLQQFMNSTVAGNALAPLRVNNTARSTDWCLTATLAAPKPRPLPPRY